MSDVRFQISDLEIEIRGVPLILQSIGIRTIRPGSDGEPLGEREAIGGARQAADGGRDER